MSLKPSPCRRHTAKMPQEASPAMKHGRVYHLTMQSRPRTSMWIKNGIELLKNWLMYFKFQKILLSVSSLINNSQGSLFSFISHCHFIQRHSKITLVFVFKMPNQESVSIFFLQWSLFHKNFCLFKKCIYFFYKNAVTIHFWCLDFYWA